MLKQIKAKFLSSTFLKDSFWSLAGSILSKGLMFIGSVFVAKELGKISFGEFNIIKNTVLSFSILTTLGIGYSSTQFIANEIDPNKKRKIAITSLLITIFFGCLISIIVFFARGFVAKNLFFSDEVSSKMYIVTLWIFCNALSTTLIGVFSGFKLFKQLAMINAIHGLFSFLLIIALTWYFGFIGAIYSLFLSQLLFFILGIYLLAKKLNWKFEVVKFNDLKLLLSTSIPLALQEVTYAVGNWLLYYLIIKFMGQGNYGLFSASYQWLAVLLTIPGILRNVMLSYFTSVKESEVIKIIKKTILINILIIIIPLILITPFLGVIEREVYGKDFDGVGILIFYSMITAIFMCVGNIYTQVLISKNKNWSLFFGKLMRDYGIIILLIVLQFFGYLNLIGIYYLIIVFNIIFIIWSNFVMRKHVSSI